MAAPLEEPVSRRDDRFVGPCFDVAKDQSNGDRFVLEHEGPLTYVDTRTSDIETVVIL